MPTNGAGPMPAISTTFNPVKGPMPRSPAFALYAKRNLHRAIMPGSLTAAKNVELSRC